MHEVGFWQTGPPKSPGRPTPTNQTPPNLVKDSNDENTMDRKLSLSFLMATSVACIALSAINPSKALWIYLFNLGEPLVARWMTVKASRSEAH
jgi:hypothetical protein